MNDSVDLSDELVTYYQQILVTHATNPETGTCAVCGVARCPDWANAYDTLAMAHLPMSTEPPAWEAFRPLAKPSLSCPASNLAGPA